ncbi:MAG: phenylalanine--tRNA ligase subunit alpha [Elusimicrobiota bacterium]
MNREEWLSKLSALKNDFARAVSEKKPSQDLERDFLSKKGGLALLLRELSAFSIEEKKELGSLGNDFKKSVLDHISQNPDAVEQSKLSAELDLTLCGHPYPHGSIHPVTVTTEKIVSSMSKMGFSLEYGPLVEMDYFNFEALNFPPDHPARDMQDTFYLPQKDERGSNYLLRTHTSPVQVRTMQSRKPPLRVISTGKVFRSEAVDASHSFVFHQLEGFCADKNISMSDLKWTMESFIKDMFGSAAKIRFAPSYFPFVEPGAGVEVSCVFCSSNKGKCPVCKGTGWLELIGAGMIHPEVFKACGYNPQEVSGFAFGAGIDRFAMLLYGITDMRQLFENDLRILKNL